MAAIEIIGDVAGGDVTSGGAVVYGVVVIDGGRGGCFVDGAFAENQPICGNGWEGEQNKADCVNRDFCIAIYLAGNAHSFGLVFGKTGDGAFFNVQKMADAVFQ